MEFRKTCYEEAAKLMQTFYKEVAILLRTWYEEAGVMDLIGFNAVKRF